MMSSMESGIRIGNTELTNYSAAVAEAIESVAKCHQDREIVLRALEVLEKSTSIQGVTITGSSVINYDQRPGAIPN